MRSGPAVLGIDPGPVAGIVLLRPCHGPRAFQCNAEAVPWLAHQLCDAADISCCGIEGFAPGTGPGSRMAGGQVTRVMITELEAIFSGYGILVKIRYAAAVKPWATDRRLDQAGLIAVTAGSTHARDAARHALYCAHWDLGWADPLGKGA